VKLEDLLAVCEAARDRPKRFTSHTDEGAADQVAQVFRLTFNPAVVSAMVRELIAAREYYDAGVEHTRTHGIAAFNGLSPNEAYEDTAVSQARADYKHATKTYRMERIATDEVLE